MRWSVIFILLLGFWLRVAQLDRFPVGVSYDEKINVLDSYWIAHTGVYPLYEEIDRPEPIDRIFLSIANLLWGGGVWSNRLLSAFIGTITLALAYWAFLRLVPRRSSLYVRYVSALCAVASLSLALGHITLSRAIYRGIFVPPVVFLFLGLLATALKTGKNIHWIQSGIALGTSVYTYTAAYVLPISVAFFALPFMLFKKIPHRTKFQRLSLLVGFMLLTMSLFLAVLVTTPRAVLSRTADVNASRQNDAITLINGMIQQIFVAGDENPQYNVALAPIIPNAFAPFFVVGVIVLLLRPKDAASWLVLSCLVLFSLPAMLSEELTHGLRVVGWFGVFPLVVGIGIHVLLRFIPLRPVLKFGFLAIIFSAFIPMTYQVHQAYLHFWQEPESYPVWRVHGTRLNHNDWFFRADRRELAQWMLAENTQLLIPLRELTTSETFAWFLPQLKSVSFADDLSMISSDARLLQPYDLAAGGFMEDEAQYALWDAPKLVILPPFDLDSRQRIAQSNVLETLSRDPNASAYTVPYLARVLEAPKQLATEMLQNVNSFNFQGDIALKGVYSDLLLPSDGGTIHVGLSWQPLRRLGRDYWTFVQIQTQDYEKVVGYDRNVLRWVYPSFAWQPFNNVSETYAMQLPPLEAGAYRLVTGFYVYARQPLDVYDGESFVGKSATVAWFKVPLENTNPLPSSALRLDVNFADAIRLQGVEVRHNNEPNALDVCLYWIGLVNRPSFDATIFVHAYDSSGILAQEDTRPLNGRYPTFIWDEQEEIMTCHTLALPYPYDEDVFLRVGLYTFGNNITRLRAVGDNIEDDTAVLGRVVELIQDTVE